MLRLDADGRTRFSLMWVNPQFNLTSSSAARICLLKEIGSTLRFTADETPSTSKRILSQFTLSSSHKCSL